MTNLYTCLDGFAYCKGNVRNRIQDKLFEISHHVSNSLAMLKKVPGVKKPSKSEAFPEYGKLKDGFPLWVSPKERKLLQVVVNETKFNLVVAKDGTGNFTTIREAIVAAPNSSTTRQDDDEDADDDGDEDDNGVQMGSAQVDGDQDGGDEVAADEMGSAHVAGDQEGGDEVAGA